MTPEARAAALLRAIDSMPSRAEAEALVARTLRNVVRRTLYAAADAVVDETPWSNGDSQMGITNAAWTVRRYARRICNKNRARARAACPTPPPSETT